jgi:hypothetical protein
LAVETTDYVHDVAEDDGAVESSWLGLLLSDGFDLGPLSLVDVELVDVIEPLLVGVDTSKDVNLITTYHG